MAENTYTSEHMVLTGHQKGTIARCDVRINEDFLVRGVSVRKAQNGHTFAAMPQYQLTTPDGKTEYHDIAHPTSKEGREALNQAVLSAYHALTIQKSQAALAR